MTFEEWVVKENTILDDERLSCKLAWDAAFNEAYLIARGGENRFEAHGSRQLYWKGRSDAADEIRKANV